MAKRPTTYLKPSRRAGDTAAGVSNRALPSPTQLANRPTKLTPRAGKAWAGQIEAIACLVSAFSAVARGMSRARLITPA
jgi:hypothetical protein